MNGRPHRLPDPDPFDGVPEDWHDSAMEAFVENAQRTPAASDQSTTATDQETRDKPVGETGVLRTSPRTRPSVRRAPVLDAQIESYISGDNLEVVVDLPELPARPRNAGGNTTMMLMHRANSSSRRAPIESGSSASHSALDLHTLEVIEADDLPPYIPPKMAGKPKRKRDTGMRDASRSTRAPKLPPPGPAPAGGLTATRRPNLPGESPAPLPFMDCEPTPSQPLRPAPAPPPSATGESEMDPWPTLNPWPTDE